MVYSCLALTTFEVLKVDAISTSDVLTISIQNCPFFLTDNGIVRESEGFALEFSEVVLKFLRQVSSRRMLFSWLTTESDKAFAF